MTSKLVDDLYMTSTVGTYHSDIMDMGGHNGAMVELWATSATDFDQITATLYGSNDKANWTVINDGTDYTATTSAAPGYDERSGTAVIPFSYVRLKLVITEDTTTATALVSAAVRTYMAA